MQGYGNSNYIQGQNDNKGGGQSFEVYKKIKLLGQGAFGKAFLVECQSDKTLAVIKQVDIGGMSMKEREDTLKEAKILEVFNHPNIVRFREVYKTKKGKLCIVMDYADGGDLQKLIQAQLGKAFSENQILDWFTQISLAMKHIHDRKILHRDIKCQNIFLTRSKMIKMGDFGIARVLNHTHEVARSMVGTPYYLSPEIIQGRPYSFKSDIWSLGVMFYELCALKPPFDGTNIHFLGMKIVKGEYPPLPSQFSREIKNLIAQMLNLDVSKRITINQVLKTPIIARRIKQFLNEDVFKDEFSHTILHKHNVMIHGPIVKPPTQLPQLDKPPLSRQPSAPQIQQQQYQRPVQNPVMNKQSPAPLPQPLQQQPQAFQKQASPGRFNPSPVVGTPSAQNQVNNVFNRNPPSAQRQQEPPASDQQRIGFPYNNPQNAVDRFERERQERLKKQEEEKKMKEEKHKAMLDDIKKKKEEFIVKNAPQNQQQQQNQYNKIGQRDQIKDQIVGVKNKIHELYSRQNSAQSQLATEESGSKTPRNVFDDRRDRTPPKVAISNLRQRTPQQQEEEKKQQREFNNKYIEDQYAQYVKQLNNVLDNKDDEQDNNNDDDASQPLENEQDGINNNQENLGPEQDRDDDADFDITPTKIQERQDQLKDFEIEENEPFNLADLRVSMVQKPDELRESTNFFEQMLREQVGDVKYRKAAQIIDKFKGGEIFFEKYEQALVKVLEREVFKNEESIAVEFIRQYSSYSIMKQSMNGGGANAFYFGIGENYSNQNNYLFI
ncbi:protein kinase domain containing protein [Stylonychia lemnae]|uniref:non-specific serine/threonine protein kinase n=1 Tax=Stylonychia lemnae TaxID=5949 RepID=A0A077ZT83_STYLE|nr:protein kinase domain containing protein [Stylonychia lemnae]|eukprot:CDW72535.1 protein kinase domain containing protein [Stylonychia lemnae]